LNKRRSQAVCLVALLFDSERLLNLRIAARAKGRLQAFWSALPMRSTAGFNSQPLFESEKFG
jgi:hypothetical protein